MRKTTALGNRSRASKREHSLSIKEGAGYLLKIGIFDHKICFITGVFSSETLSYEELSL